MGRGANAVSDPVDLDDFDVLRSAATSDEILSNSISDTEREFRGILKSYHKTQKRIWPLLLAYQDDFQHLRERNPRLWRQIVQAAAYYRLPNPYGKETFPRWISELVRESRLSLDLTPYLYSTGETKPGTRSSKRQRLHLRATAVAEKTLCGVEVADPESIPRRLRKASQFAPGNPDDYIRCDRCLKVLRDKKGEEWAPLKALAAQRSEYLPPQQLKPLDDEIVSAVEAKLLAQSWQSSDEMVDALADLYWPIAMQAVIRGSLNDFFQLESRQRFDRLTMPYANAQRDEFSSLHLFRREALACYGEPDTPTFPWPSDEELRQLFAETITIVHQPGTDRSDDEENWESYYDEEELFVALVLERLFPEVVERTLTALYGVDDPDDLIRFWRRRRPGSDGHDLDFLPV